MILFNETLIEFSEISFKPKLHMITKEQIDLMKDVIVETMQPEKIYLFGSYATGEATEDSDVDVLIEVSHSEERPVFRSNSLTTNMYKHKQLLFDTDIFVYTTDEINKFKKEKYSFLTMALKNSLLIYSID